MLEPFTIEYGIDRDNERYWMITIPHGRAWNDQYYALGFKPPNYPVPAIPHKVCFYASGDCIEIRSFKGIGSKQSYIDKIFRKPV